MATNEEYSDFMSESNDCVEMKLQAMSLMLPGDGDFKEKPFASTLEDEIAVMELIEGAANRGDKVLNLSGKGLLAFPETLLSLPQLEILYMDHNSLGHLPEDLFLILANLKWLDLRNNCLTSIPADGLTTHEKLRGLLLAHNLLETFPPEIGMVKTMGTFLCYGNPLKCFPDDLPILNDKIVLVFLRNSRLFDSSDYVAWTPGMEAREQAAMERRQGFVSRHVPLPPIGTAYKDTHSLGRCRREDDENSEEDINKNDFSGWISRKHKMEKWFAKYKRDDENGATLALCEEVPEIVDNPPYGIDETLLRLIRKEERKTIDIFTSMERPRARPLSPASKEDFLKIKLLQLYQAEKAIKNHVITRYLRRHEYPSSTTSEGTTALFETLAYEQLHRDLAVMHVDMEVI